MNGWRARLLLACVFAAVANIHHFVMASIPNTPEWMAVYHGSAGALDWTLLLCSSWLISGRLCDDIQYSCIASIVVNLAGFCAYMAYAPPDIYNYLIAGVSYAQYIRLLYVGRYDADYHERAVVRGTDRVGTAAHS